MPPDADVRTLAALRVLLDRAHLATAGQLPQVVSEAAGELGWTAVIYLVDDEQRLLLPVPVPGAHGGVPQLVEDSLAGRCFRTVEPVRWSSAQSSAQSSADLSCSAQGSRAERGVWLPVLDGAHRLGVLKVTVDPGAADTDLNDPDESVFEERCRLLAHLVGHLVVAKSAYGDGLTGLQRLRPRTVASELLWRLLPPLTFACEGLVVSALLQPVYDVAADAFDYSITHDTAHLTVMDGTGHDLSGTLLAAVALSAYRSSRRQGLGLLQVAAAMDQYVAEQGRLEKFVTGIVGELDLSTGVLRYLNAGHPAPLLMRKGRVVKELSGGRRILFGLRTGEGQVAQDQLEPDDWVVLYTDGITEARSTDGTFFGLPRLVDQLERSAAEGQPAPETLRRVIRDVLAHQNGVLQDDATVLIIQWATGDEHRMISTRTSTVDPRELFPADQRGAQDLPRA